MSVLKVGFVAALIGLASAAEACSPHPKYFDLSLEQQVSDAKLILMGRVTAIRDQIVVTTPDEVLRGERQKRYKVKQGFGADCHFEFTVGKKIFYAGTLAFGPTTEFEDTLPPKLLPVVEKLRRGETLETIPKGYFDN